MGGNERRIRRAEGQVWLECVVDIYETFKGQINFKKLKTTTTREYEGFAMKVSWVVSCIYLK